MSLSLPKPPDRYSQEDQAQARAASEREDKKNIKTGMVIDKLLFRDTADDTIKTVVITSGAFVIT